MVKATGQGVEAVAIGLDVKLDGANEKLEQELSKTTKKLSAVFANATGAGFATAGAAVVGVVAALGAAMALTVGASTKFEDSFAGIKKTVNWYLENKKWCEYLDFQYLLILLQS